MKESWSPVFTLYGYRVRHMYSADKKFFNKKISTNFSLFFNSFI